MKLTIFMVVLFFLVLGFWMAVECEKGTIEESEKGELWFQDNTFGNKNK